MRHPIRSHCALLAMLAGLSACAAPGTSPTVALASKDAPVAVGPYSQAIRSGRLVFLAGQVPIDPRTGQANLGSIEAQTTQVMDNLKAVLAAGGMSFADVVATTVYVKDLDDFSRLNAVYATYFSDRPPARATVQVQRLPKEAAVEISAIAVH